jgi:hypothetical protein
MQGLARRIMAVAAAALVGTAAFVALANPGGTLVVVDELEEPDVAIQEVRADNTDATHVPVRVRLTVPARYVEEGRTLRWANLTAYLTKSTDPADDPLQKEIVKLGGQWSNRSVIVEVPSPGEGHYFLHVTGELHFDDRTSITLTTTSTQRIHFGQPQDCGDVKEIEIPGVDAACPVLFATKSSTSASASDARLRAANEKVLDSVVAHVDALCASGTLHRVSIRGWASPLHSVNPTNEELAQLRSENVWREVQKRVSGCAERVHDDSGPGLQAVTTQFGEGDRPNQCVQIKISSHSCNMR